MSIEEQCNIIIEYCKGSDWSYHHVVSFISDISKGNFGVIIDRFKMVMVKT